MEEEEGDAASRGGAGGAFLGFVLTTDTEAKTGACCLLSACPILFRAILFLLQKCVTSFLQTILQPDVRVP